jgi:hypothetical protein
MQGVVHTLGTSGAASPRNHETATREAIARRLAALKGYRFGGEFDERSRCSQPIYFVPADTLVGLQSAARLGIHHGDHLFGAVVPHAFVATKAITHPAALSNSHVPVGWVGDFAERIAHCVLDGCTAFTRDDLQHAALAMLERGDVRIKRSVGVGGRGQWVVQGPDDLAAIVAALDDDEIAATGVVVEQQLADVVTYSVGQVRVAGTIASYWGVQRLTPNNTGTEVYGGSELHVTRGDFDALLAQPLDEEVRLAVRQACAYDAAAFECFAPMFASRRNYDVARGRDANGELRCGVLEQSWRIGGASGAEVLALEAFVADPNLSTIDVATVEVYGASDAPPADAFVCFRDVDDRVGPITKYARIGTHADAR